MSNIYKDYKDVFFPRILEDKTVTDVDKDKIKALLAKPFNPCKDLETSESGSNLYIFALPTLLVNLMSPNCSNLGISL